MEKLIIENFAGIKSMQVDINTINIVIGAQASGKSIIAKLLFYFKSFINEIKRGIEDNKTKKEIDKGQLIKFLNYFPRDTWPENKFQIKYLINDTEFTVSKKANAKNIEFSYSGDLKSIIKEGRKLYKQEIERFNGHNELIDFETGHNFSIKFDNLIEERISNVLAYNQFFIPAGRSYFSNIQSNIFTFLSSNKSIDPFLIQFGSIYENFKRFANEVVDSEIEELIKSIINSDYIRVKEKDFLVHSDDRKVSLFNASSGQQEILPLLLILKVLRFISIGKGAVLYIEEPEAHLFPTAQNNVIRILARVFNSNNNFQFFLTTHSPYILSSFNNLMYAGYLVGKSDEEKHKEIFKIEPEEEILNPNMVSTSSIDNNGKLVNAINKETKLIDQNILDEVSNKISIEFGNLLELE